MLCEYSHRKSESLAQICTIMAEIQHFSMGLFFIGAPCIPGHRQYPVIFEEDLQRSCALTTYHRRDSYTPCTTGRVSLKKNTYLTTCALSCACNSCRQTSTLTHWSIERADPENNKCQYDVATSQPLASCLHTSVMLCIGQQLQRVACNKLHMKPRQKESVFR